VLLSLCDGDMSVDMNLVMQHLPGINPGRVKTVALMLGLRIKGGS